MFRFFIAIFFVMYTTSHVRANDFKEVILVLNPTGASLQTSKIAHQFGYRVYAIYDSQEFYEHRDSSFDGYMYKIFIAEPPTKIVEHLREQRSNITAVYISNEGVFSDAWEICSLAKTKNLLLGPQVESFLSLQSPGIFYKKSDLQTFLQKNNLSNIPFLKVRHIALDQDYFLKELLFPLVLKPDNSFGTKNVYVLQDRHQLKEVLKTLPHDEHGKLFEDWILQSFQNGDLYIVDLIAGFNSRSIPFIWKYKMLPFTSNAPLFDYVDLVSPDDPVVDVLSSYAMSIFDKLENPFARMHLEVFVQNNEDGSFRVLGAIDNGYRLGGGLVPISSIAMNFDIAEKEFLVSINRSSKNNLAPELDFKKRLLQSWMPQKHAKIISIPGIRIHGNVKSKEEILSEISSLSSFYAYRPVTPFGVKAPYESTNIFNLIARVELVHKDLDVLYSDYLKIETLKRQGFFIKSSSCESTFD